MVIVSVLAGLFALYALVLLVVAYAMVFPFRVPIFSSPGMMGEPQESVRFTSDDGVELRGWWVPVEGSTVVVFCHGYLVNRSEFVPLTSLFTRRGASCLFFDFRAHGWSGGRKSLFGAAEHLDVAAAVRFVRERRPDARIVLFGSSMGAAAAVFAAADGVPADALVLDSPYATLDEATRGWWKYLDQGRWEPFLRPVSWIGRVFTRVNPRSVQTGPAFERVAGRPVLFLFGAKDPLAPRASAERLLAQAGPRARAVWFERSGHTEGRFHEPERYLAEVVEFLESQGLMLNLS